MDELENIFTNIIEKNKEAALIYSIAVRELEAYRKMMNEQLENEQRNVDKKENKEKKEGLKIINPSEA